MGVYGTARAQAIGWAAETIERADVLYLDTETTGLRNSDELVDIAVIDNSGRILLNSLIKPRQSIPRDATAIHGITNQMVLHPPGLVGCLSALPRIDGRPSLRDRL